MSENRCKEFEPHYSVFCQLIKEHDGPHAFFWKTKVTEGSS